MKIILFYSSIGQGHISAARVIEQEIRKNTPSATVVMKDIRDFMDSMKRKLDEKMYWFVAKNLPDLFDNKFISMQELGNKTGSLTWLPNDYPEIKVLEYLKEEAPDAILATHYGSAQVLGTLKEKGYIPGIKIGWLHTDYFEGYFPRISKRIDMTFLAHHELENRWLAAGVSSELINVTGMPVNIPMDILTSTKDCLAKIGFDHRVKTITISGGKEGFADFSGVVMSIARTTKEPVQIIAVCGHNENQLRALTKFQKCNSKQVNLKVLGFIPQTDLVSFICASDVYITKAGGISPAEAFTIGKPTILLNEISGHERENAELFSRLGMAEFNTDVKIVGTQVQEILSDQEKQASMMAVQKAYRDNIDIKKIAQFLLDPQVKARCTNSEFGIEKGIAVNNAQKVLAQLEIDVPADMEILLSYSSSIEDERIVKENPFGHVAIRIGDTVYSANHLSHPEKGTPLLQHMSLDQYLFGIVPPTDDQLHTSTYGMSYGRDTLGFRIKGLSQTSLEKMHDYAARIENEFLTGKCKWNKYSSNCADFVERILHNGGYDIEYVKSPGRIVTMPLDIFEKALAVFEGDQNLQTELVAYRRLPGSQSSYRFSRFPLSLWQPVRALMQVLRDQAPDTIEQKVSRQLTGYIGDDQIYYENLRARLSTSGFDSLDRSSSRFKAMEHIFWEDAVALIARQTSRTVEVYKEKTEQYFMRELNDLMKNNFFTSKILTEYYDMKSVSRKLETHLKSRYYMIGKPLKRVKRRSVINPIDHDRPHSRDNKSNHLHSESV